ncbi:hypothetical protein ACFQPA_06810 [Halomarina halobia]|uniref:Uncharacterized protein n=1 Tax=Halomarina halobia TaxID=3033386 RepID=A0ABD6A716_9EURY|nr:hypothetical protein [Halomarina sp. PSR21]
MALTGYLAALTLGALPAVGDFAGGLLAEAIRVPERTLRPSLHLAAGMVLGVIGVTIGYWAVRGQPPVVKLGLLAFTVGILLTVVVEDTVPEPHEGEQVRLAAVAPIFGFALFGLVAVYP